MSFEGRTREGDTAVKNFWLLMLWLAIGTCLRFTYLAAKPPWTDEFSTLVFSLGNSFRGVPLDTVINLDTLLQPLVPNPTATITDVWRNLVTESNHPPLYFMLTHWWMQLWPVELGGLVSVWGARSLSAILGALSVLAIYGLAYLAFRSQLVSHLAAAIMAVSSFGIFLAQEARHYTIAVLWVIASLACLVIATRQIQSRKPFPIWVIIAWITVNALGIASHYFFAFTLLAEGIWVLVLAWRQLQAVRAKKPVSWQPWWQIAAVAIGSALGCLVWLPIFLNSSQGDELTTWIQSGNNNLLTWIAPIFQILAAWFGMLYNLPVSATSLYIVIPSGVGILLFFLWAFPILKRGFTNQLKQPKTTLMTQLFTVIVLGAVSLFFFFTYFLGIDLTRGARYNFVYFPAFVILLAGSISYCWNQTKNTKLIPTAGKNAVAIILIFAFIGGITVVTNLSYPKYYRPEQLVPTIQKVSQAPILIATTHKTHVQIGEMMGLGREFKRLNSQVKPSFLLAQQTKNPNLATATLQKELAKIPRPLDLWLVNFHAPVENLNGCTAKPLSSSYVYGYDYRLYNCN